MKTIAAAALACTLAIGISGTAWAQSNDMSGNGADTQMNGDATPTGNMPSDGTMMKKPMKHHMAKKPMKHAAKKKMMMKSNSTM